MKAELEQQADKIVSEMRRIVEAALIKLPPKIKGMRMSELVTDYGGDASLVFEKEKKLTK